MKILFVLLMDLETPLIDSDLLTMDLMENLRETRKKVVILFSERPLGIFMDKVYAIEGGWTLKLIQIPISNYFV